jgi:glycine dehydrogenase subunit 2
MYKKLLFELSRDGRRGHYLPECDVPERDIDQLLDSKYLRKKEAELPQIAENEIVRHYTALSTMNHHVDKAFYPLGSCTMKYNPKINEKMAGHAQFAQLHPEQDADSVQGALEILYELQEYLKEITGMSGVSLQPAAGSQGELVGLLLMQKYHDKKGNDKNTILIPDSAHGTNPASAIIAGYSIKTIKSNDKGVVDLADLEEKLSADVAGFMLTNPNTLGIFEHQVQEIRKMLDAVDAIFYMDGANMNALFGIVRPGDMGFDVMHLNLHKSFSTPHGGGGPGTGPVAVNSKLESFLPRPLIQKSGHTFIIDNDMPESIGKVHSFFGNFGLLLRAYVYIRLVGAKGFRNISEHAIINANYLYSRLKDRYDISFESPAMHEFVLSAEKQKDRGAKAMDIAKRLLDFGVHPPTIYFPTIVKEAMMIEPTETESKEMLDYFADAMIRIDDEIDQDPNILHSAPHVTPVKRLDEVGAARNIDVNYFKPKQESKQMQTGD